MAAGRVKIPPPPACRSGGGGIFTQSLHLGMRLSPKLCFVRCSAPPKCNFANMAFPSGTLERGADWWTPLQSHPAVSALRVDGVVPSRHGKTRRTTEPR